MTQSIAYLIAEDYEFIQEKHPQFEEEFQRIQSTFAKYDKQLIKIPWRYNTVDWTSFAAVIPKACWDYVYYPAEFKSLLEHISQLNIPLYNDLSLILWNMRKTYLQDLQKQHLRVAEFLLIPQYSPIDDMDVFAKKIRDLRWKPKMIIAKPSIGMGSVNNRRFHINDIHLQEKFFTQVLSRADLILQPFFQEDVDIGEYSYIFFNNQFSHAVLKKPAKNDYRAHFIYGAEITAYQPTQEEIQQAFTFIDALSPAPKYARVDVFKHKDHLYLIELELIEPYLYLEYADKEVLDSFCKII
jgi:hypothetical protein